jgi:quinoprotein glucose dehydrogenase
MRSAVLSAALTAAARLVAIPSPSRAAPVTAESLLQAQEGGAEWLLYGRDYRNTRYSPLMQLTPDNVAQLRPVFA